MLELTGPLAVAGDWHGSNVWSQAAVRYAHSQGARTIIHTGDVGFFRMSSLMSVESALAEHDMMLLWVDGNHENHELIARLDRDANGLGFVSSHIRHIPRGYTFSHEGMTWMGFGGAVSVDRNWRFQGESWWPEEAITVGQAMSVTAFVDVVASHDAPTGVPFIDQFVSRPSMWPADALRDSHANRELLRMVVDEVQPRWLFHGHYHMYYTDHLNGCRVMGLDKDGSRMEHNVVVVDYN